MQTKTLFVFSLILFLLSLSLVSATELLPGDVKEIVEDYTDHYLVRKVQQELNSEYPPSKYGVTITSSVVSEDSIKLLDDTGVWMASVDFNYTVEKKGDVNPHHLRKLVYVNDSSRFIVNLDKISSGEVWECAEQSTDGCAKLAILVNDYVVRGNESYYQNILENHGITDKIKCYAPSLGCWIGAHTNLSTLIKILEYDWVIEVSVYHKGRPDIIKPLESSATTSITPTSTSTTTTPMTTTSMVTTTIGVTITTKEMDIMPTKTIKDVSKTPIDEGLDVENKRMLYKLFIIIGGVLIFIFIFNFYRQITNR